MTQVKMLNTAELAQIDGGRLAAALEKELKHCVRDCIDRPNVDRSRKVTLQLEVSPVMDEHGQCDTCEAKFQIKSTIPERKTRKFSMGVKQDGGLYWNEHSPDNVHQGTFDSMDEDDDQVPPQT